MDFIIKTSVGLRGTVKLPGDKSISHRAAILLPLCHGDAVVNNFLFAEDTLHTLNAMRMLGADIKIEGKKLIFKSAGKDSLRSSNKLIYLGNSGTSIRLMSGLLSNLRGNFLLYGDNSLQNRPMGRVINPLKEMGADIKSLYNNDMAPILINGGKLHGIEYKMNIPSAQVKSAILLAGLFAEGKTKIFEKESSRDHTERMMKYLEANINSYDNGIELIPNRTLVAKDLEIPGDASSAAFIFAAAALTKNSTVEILDICLNRTRTGFLEVFKQMGGEYELFDLKEKNNEPIGSIRVKNSNLKGVKIEGEIIPKLIDEIPLIAVLATFADGETVIKDAKELRYKESDRIKAIVYNLREMGVQVEELEDGMTIKGRSYKKKDNYVFNSFTDHRIAMSFSLVGLVLDNTRVIDCKNINTSFPEFESLMRQIGANIVSVY